MALSIPVNFRHTRSTPFWTKDTLPEALLTCHNTKAGVYGRLCVMRGAVKYIGLGTTPGDTAEMEVVINAGSFGISPPQYYHKIELLTDDTCFNIDFFADPETTLEGKGLGQVVASPKK